MRSPLASAGVRPFASTLVTIGSGIPSMSVARTISECTETSVSALGASSRPPGTVMLFPLIAWKMSETVAPVPIKRSGSGRRGTRA